MPYAGEFKLHPDVKAALEKLVEMESEWPSFEQRVAEFWRSPEGEALIPSSERKLEEGG